MRDSVIPRHGGFRELKTFQLAELIYDVTFRFCNLYIDRRSRTHDQMVQAARSGRQNIAEGSEDSATSKKSELKLTGISKGSLKELQLDYEDYLRHREWPEWEPDHPSLMRFKEKRCATLAEFRRWVADECRMAGNPGLAPICAANGALSLLNLCLYLLKRQLDAQARDFLKQGGFTENLHRLRSREMRKTRTNTD